MTPQEQAARALDSLRTSARDIPESPQTAAQAALNWLYENAIGSGAIDTPGEKFGATLNDMGKSLGSGLAKGAAGLVTLPQTLGGLMDTGMEYMTGVPMQSALPDAGQMTRDAVEAGTGYTPQTTAGRYTKTVGEFGPGIVMNPMTAIAAGIGSEGGADIAKYLNRPKWEAPARIAGALAAPSIANKALAPLLRKLVTPNVANPEALAASKVLRAEGIPTTAGQRTGNFGLLNEEAVSPRMATVIDKQVKAFTEATLKRIGAASPTATGKVIADATKRIGSVFDDVATQTPVLRITPAQTKALDDALALYNESVGTQAALPRNIVAKIRNANGNLPTSVYQNYWTKLGPKLKSSDEDMREFAIAARNILDDALQASATPENAQRLAVARGQYRDLLAIEKTLNSTSGARGIITPARLRTAVAQQGNRQYVQGQRDLGNLADAGVVGMTPLPDSGTAGRLSAMLGRVVGPGAIGGGGAGAGLGAMIGGPPGALIGGGAGAILPALRNVARMSKPGQAYLGNQLMTQAPQIKRSLMELLMAPAQATNSGQSVLDRLNGPR